MTVAARLSAQLDRLKAMRVPCGRTMGHGESCDAEGHMCDQCTFITSNIRTLTDLVDRARNAQPDTKVEKLKQLILTAHPHKPNDRCTAREKPREYPMGRPPGPANPPIFCCLPAGHEGPHKCNHGGMSVPFAFRKDAEVEMREPGPGSCTTCRTGWPCATVKAMEEILQDH